MDAAATDGGGSKGTSSSPSVHTHDHSQSTAGAIVNDQKPTGVRKSKAKKRRSLSCQTCRKLKTRCDYDPAKRMCHRCYMLRLDCSLQTEPPPVVIKREEPVEEHQDPVHQRPHQHEASGGTSLVGGSGGGSNSNSSIEEMELKMDAMMRAMADMQRMVGEMYDKRAQRTIRLEQEDKKHNVSKQYDGLAPLVEIRDIDYKLFNRKERYEPVREASEELVAWINSRVEYCESMISIFRAKCGNYLISNGSISKQTPLLAGILTLQGMRCDDKATHDDTQAQLFGIVRRVLGAVLMTNPVHIGDIEAMLYMSMFNPARKPKQPIFDSWLLTSYGIKLFMVSAPVAELFEGISLREEVSVDNLYLVRLWNNLVVCHLQYAIASGKPVMVPEDHMDMCDKMLEIPSRCAADTYVATEIQLLRIQNRLMTEDSAQVLETGEILQFPALEQWRSRNWQHVDVDPVKSLGLGYDYCKVLLASRLVRKMNNEQESASVGSSVASVSPRRRAYQVAIESSSSIIRQFLDLTPARIEGMPNYPLCILIYAALTLCRFIQHTPDRAGTLNVVTRIYWYLYHIGNQPRNIVHSIANIIRSVVEEAQEQQQQQQQQQQTPPQQRQDTPPLPPPQVPIEVMMNGVMAMHNENSLIPDISQCSSYDEFFEGMFSYVQGAAQPLTT